jgi:ferredoxin
VEPKADQRKVFNVSLLTPTGRHAIRVAEDEHIWDAAFRQNIELPALCHQGWCLTCAGRIEGAGAVDHTDSRAFYPQDREASFALLCTAKPCSDLTIVTHQAGEMRRHRLRNRLPAPYSQGLKP